MKKFLTPQTLVSIAAAQAVLAFAGSLYFSNVELFIPCEFCWWQRIALYPQVILFIVALLRKDWKVYQYSLPLLLGGWLLSLYHNILYYNVNFFHPSSTVVPCGLSGISCTTRYIEYFGFITIPLLSFLAFSLMGGCMLFLWWIDRKKQA
jgi:disulfide bond formation protein DsbB